MKKYRIVLVSEFKSELNEMCCSTLIDYVKANSLQTALQATQKIVSSINVNNDIMYRIECIEAVSECKCKE